MVLIYDQILRNSQQRNVTALVRRINFQILGVKGLKVKVAMYRTANYILARSRRPGSHSKQRRGSIALALFFLIFISRRSAGTFGPLFTI